MSEFFHENMSEESSSTDGSSSDEEFSSKGGRLSAEEILRFIKKPTPLELFLLARGDFWDVMLHTLLNADSKPEDMMTFLKAITRLQCHPEIDVQCPDEDFFKLIYDRDNRSEYSAVVVEQLKVFCKSDEEKIELVVSYDNPELKFLLESCQKERFRLMSQQGLPGFIPQECFVDKIFFGYHMDILRDLLIAGASFDFSLDAFTSFKKNFIEFHHDMFRLSVDDNYSTICQNLEREGLLQVIYRTMQTFQFHHDLTSNWIDMSESKLDTMRYFWISIPDPFLTKEDFDGIFSGLNFDYDGACQSWYANELKLSADWMRQPRSLRHISRCVIRRRLAKSLLLPNIESLPLPKEMHSYLNFSNLEDIY